MTEAEELKTLIEKLKNNEEKVGKDLLKTKYKKPYAKLKSEIKKVAEGLMNESLIEGLLVRNNEEGYLFLSKVSKLLKLKKQEGFSKILGKVLTEEYSITKFLSEVQGLKSEIMRLYKEYKEKEDVG